MARSIWKGFFISKSVHYSLLKIFFLRQRRWIIYSRSSVIPSFFLNSICGVHKGFMNKHFLVRGLYIGRKFGEFSFTRKNYHFIPKEKKSKLRR